MDRKSVYAVSYAAIDYSGMKFSLSEEDRLHIFLCIAESQEEAQQEALKKARAKLPQHELWVAKAIRIGSLKEVYPLLDPNEILALTA